MAGLRTKNLESYLSNFGKRIIQHSKKILKAKKKNVSSKLLNSLKYVLKKEGKGFTLSFKGADYADFVDKGVSGKDKRRYYKDTKGKRRQSPFRYKSKQPPSGVLDKWIVRKGIAPRDEKGRFMKRKSLAFLIARKIKHKGIEGTSFFSTPIYVGMKEFKKEILNNFKADIITSFEKI